MADLFKSFFKSIILGDLLIFTILVLIAILHLPYSKAKHSTLQVYKAGALIGSYALNEDMTLKIDEHNTIEIKGGKAAITYSDCPDKRCVKQGFQQNMPIICMPNQLILKFNSGSREPVFILQ